MDSFRTTIPVQRAPFSIDHTDGLMLAGSCFTEHIGNRLADAKFSARVNPFGIVYNPLSIARCLERLWAADRPFHAAELFENAGLWRSWEHHSAFAGTTPEDALRRLNEAYSADAAALRQTSRLLLTFGTADVFMLRSTGQVVANNHKMPAAHFDSRRLSAEETTDAICNILEPIHAAQPGLKVVLTVSPVRHLRAGAVANQRSKAVLVLACEAICRRLPFVHYFPAYELLLDDLRDYRFYAADMIHPSEVAVSYIWDHFVETFCSPETRQLMDRIGKIRRAAQHRPFHRDTEDYRKFAEAQRDAIARLKAEQPGLDFGEELAYFQET